MGRGRLIKAAGSSLKPKTLEAVLVASPTGWSFRVAYRVISESSVTVCRTAARAGTAVHGRRWYVLGTEVVPMVLKMQEDKAMVRVENTLAQA